MSERKDPPSKGKDKPYSVDDILAEYGSGKYDKGSRKVISFPEEGPDGSRPVPTDPTPPKPAAQPGQDQAPPPIAQISPKGLGRQLAARLSTLLRRADHYADHMYDQAEPDEQTVKAERYIPGVDREEPQPDEPPTPSRRKPRPSAPTPPDTAPAQLAERWQQGLKGRRWRTWLAFSLSLAAVLLSLELPLLDWSAPPLDTVRLAALSSLLALVGLLCWEVIVRGLARLCTLRPGAESLAALAWLFTLGDALVLLGTDYRQGLPCCAVTALGLAFSFWGDTLRRRGDRLGAKTAALTRTPYVVTLDEGKWNGRPAYAKWSGPAAGFGSQLQMEDAAQRAYRVAAPLLLLACLLCPLMAAVSCGDAGRFLWSASACFTAACAWSALLAYGLPYHKLAQRLQKLGAALAGWPGVARCRAAGILMTDLDLFPPGSVQVAQVRVFGGVSTEKVVAYTATLLRVFQCGLTRPFHDLLRAQGAVYREVSALRPEEGGLSGVIHNQEVLVGTASFLRVMDVPLPQGLNIKHAVFCAIDRELAGMFPLNYAMSPAVSPALSALMHAGISPILATRDFNLIPALLGQKFKLPVDKMAFPPVLRRLELSQPDQPHSDTPVALLGREGLNVYSDAVVGARRLRLAVRRSLAFTLLGAAVGVCLTFYLTYVGAWDSLTPANFLVFMLAWLVPELVLANWVNQF